MTAPRNIAPQLAAWQQRRRLTDAAAAHELEISPLLFGLWKGGTACPYAALVETKMGLRVEKVKKTAGGVITL